MTTERSLHYGNISVGGNAQAHLGDIHNHHYHRRDDDLNKEEKAIRGNALIASLRYDDMESRVHNVAMALPETCQWVFQHEIFRIWSGQEVGEEAQSLLWIKGKPGSGKSTLMKEILKWAKTTWSTSINISFFFNARGYNELEKTSLGLYRSLAYHLVNSKEAFRNIFSDMFLPGKSDPKSAMWTSTEVQSFLLAVVQAGDLPRLNLFVDALDEGTEEDIRIMLEFFQNLSEAAKSNGCLFRLCLSSRHYPRISVRLAMELTLDTQPDHVLDIERYIKKRLSDSYREDLADLRSRILERSSHIFLWVVLVIPILNRSLDRGRSAAEVRTELENIPEALSDLFLTILARHQTDFEECVTLLQYVLHSIRPMHAVELYVALKSKHDPVDLDGNPVYTEDAQNIETFYIRHHDLITRYVLDCSRGLVEETKDDHNIQLIHETVRATLLDRENRISRDSLFSDAQLSPEHSHYVLAETCLASLRHLFRRNNGSQGGARELFIPYAAMCWWQHVPLTVKTFHDSLYDTAIELLTADITNVRRLLCFFNIDRANIKNDPSNSGLQGYADVSGTRREIPNPSVVYYAAHLGISNFIEKAIASGSDIDSSGLGFRSPLHAAVYRRHVKVVEQLLAAGAELDDLENPNGVVLLTAAKAKDQEVVQILITAYARMLSSNPGAAAMVKHALVKARNIMPDDPTHPAAFLLEAAYDSQWPGAAISVRTKSRHGRERTFFFPLTMTGREIKNTYAYFEDGPPSTYDTLHNQTARFFILESMAGRGTRKFLDDWTLSSRGIEDGYVLDVVPAYRVGCSDCPHLQESRTSDDEEEEEQESIVPYRDSIAARTVMGGLLPMTLTKSSGGGNQGRTIWSGVKSTLRRFKLGS